MTIRRLVIAFGFAVMLAPFGPPGRRERRRSPRPRRRHSSRRAFHKSSGATPGRGLAARVQILGGVPRAGARRGPRAPKGDPGSPGLPGAPGCAGSRRRQRSPGCPRCARRRRPRRQGRERRQRCQLRRPGHADLPCAAVIGHVTFDRSATAELRRGPALLLWQRLEQREHRRRQRRRGVGQARFRQLHPAEADRRGLPEAVHDCRRGDPLRQGHGADRSGRAP